MNIVLVEDNLATGMLLQLQVGNMFPRANIEYFSSTATAVERISKGDIDLLITDYMMPDGIMSGLSLAIVAKSICANTKTIIVTGDTTLDLDNLEKNSKEFIRLLPDQILYKPLYCSNLETTLKKLIKNDYIRSKKIWRNPLHGPFFQRSE